MKRSGTTLAVALAVLCATAVLLAPAVRADVRRGNSEVGFDIGGTEFDSEVGSGAIRFDVRGGYHVTNWLQLEGQLGVSDENGRGNTTTLTTGLVNAVFNFHPRTNLVPYVLAGAGGARLSFGGIDDTGVAYQVAGGARFFGPGGQMGVRLELGVMGEDTFDETSTHWNLTAGFTWRIGKEKAPPPKPRPVYGHRYLEWHPFPDYVGGYRY